MLEIERKFLVTGEQWRKQTTHSQTMQQGYLNADGKASIRVRIAGEQANLNIKAAVIGRARAEYEYPIPLAEAQAILDDLTLAHVIKKTRHYVQRGGHTWEIDEFSGDNVGLVVAEIELSAEDEAFEHPEWLGPEITQEQRYYNHSLAFQPYKLWDKP